MRAKPAPSAAGRVFGASLALGVLGLAWALFVLTRLLAAWQIAAPRAAHEFSLLGARFTYPSANAAAVVLSLLAVLGLLVMVAAARGLARELLVDRRLRRGLANGCVERAHGASVLADERPQAFCAGLLRPSIYITSGALGLLDASELDAVLAHERHHARRRDPLRLACVRVLAGALFFLPALRGLVERQGALAEIEADQAAVRAAAGDRSPLAGAMLRFSGPSELGAVGLDPQRVDHLLGHGPMPRFPLVLCTWVALVLLGLVALAVAVAHLAAGTATLGLPLLSSAPCITVLALVPLGAVALALVWARAGHSRVS
jgi:hypothetical protein